MFGKRFFAPRFFAPRFFPPQPVAATTPRRRGSAAFKRQDVVWPDEPPTIFEFAGSVHIRLVVAGQVTVTYVPTATAEVALTPRSKRQFITYTSPDPIEALILAGVV